MLLFCKSNLSATRTFRAWLQGEKGYPCARVTLTSGLKLVLVYKQISQVGLPYHPGQLYESEMAYASAPECTYQCKSRGGGGGGSAGEGKGI